jgi:hypothetical protein
MEDTSSPFSRLSLITSRGAAEKQLTIAPGETRRLCEVDRLRATAPNEQRRRHQVVVEQSESEVSLLRSIIDADVEDANDVRMVKSHGELGFAPEARLADALRSFG